MIEMIIHSKKFRKGTSYQLPRRIRSTISESTKERKHIDVA